LARLIPLDGAYSVQVQGQYGLRTYNKRRDGTINVPEHDARALRREGLAVPATAAGPTAHLSGYVCPCGRRNYFRRCGSCGSTAGTKENP
jgi:hypothetical protein